jgi:hypothetical protein
MYYKFAIPKTEFCSSFNAKYEHEYVNLLSDMRPHIDEHRQERPNHKIPPTMLLNLFTRVQGKGKGKDKPKKTTMNSPAKAEEKEDLATSI